MHSAVPVLVLSGEFDPDTPPSWARLLQANLVHAPRGGDARTSPWRRLQPLRGHIALAFFHAPEAPVPVDCVLTMRSAEFGKQGMDF